MKIELKIGTTTVIYQLRYSRIEEMLKISVGTTGVQVTAPEGMTGEQIQMQIEDQAPWILEQYNSCRNTARQNFDREIAFVKGPFTNIMHRGRKLKLEVMRYKDVQSPIVSYRSSRFQVGIPAHTSSGMEIELMTKAFEKWSKEKLQADFDKFAGICCKTIGCFPKALRFQENKDTWGSCSKDGIIKLNWRLIHTPMKILEYVIVHELCHLKHQDHTDDFWSLLEYILGDYLDAKEWLLLRRLIV